MAKVVPKRVQTNLDLSYQNCLHYSYISVVPRKHTDLATERSLLLSKPPNFVKKRTGFSTILLNFQVPNVFFL